MDPAVLPPPVLAPSGPVVTCPLLGCTAPRNLTSNSRAWSSFRRKDCTSNSEGRGIRPAGPPWCRSSCTSSSGSVGGGVGGSWCWWIRLGSKVWLLDFVPLEGTLWSCDVTTTTEALLLLEGGCVIASFMGASDAALNEDR